MKPDTWFQAVFAIVAGALMISLCGLCTYKVLTSAEGRLVAPFALVIGGAPILAGGLLIYRGAESLIRRRR